MKIFITGGSGMLGQYLNIELSKNHDILTQYNLNPGNCGDYNSVQLKITDYSKLETVFNEFKPDAVIHALAVSTPEKADESSAGNVYDVNVFATKKIAELCQHYNSKLIYTSTDLVYAGYRGSYLNEESKLIPVSLYAETKLMGEVKIRETFDNYIILRVSLQIGFGLNHSINNFHKLYESIKKGHPFKLFTDQFRTPLALHESSKMIAEIVEKNISGEIFNLAGDERVSRFELGGILCEEAGFDKNLLVPSTMDEAGAAYKVADVSLNIDKLKSIGIKPSGLRESVREIILQR
jgi:dTDP-4-dehydrorhamnose reductase